MAHHLISLRWLAMEGLRHLINANSEYHGLMLIDSQTESVESVHSEAAKERAPKIFVLEWHGGYDFPDTIAARWFLIEVLERHVPAVWESRIEAEFIPGALTYQYALANAARTAYERLHI